MARPSHPWWWKERKRFAVTIEGKRHLAPPDLTEKDWLAARDWHARLLEELKPGRNRRIGALMVRDLAEMYLQWDRKRVEKNDRSRAGHESLVTRLALASHTKVGGKELGGKPISRFTAGDLEAAIGAWREEGRSEGYVVSIVAGVKAMFSWAKQPIPGRSPEKLIRENPIEGFKGPPVPEADPRFAEPAKAAAWLRWLKGRLWDRPEDRSFILIQRALMHSGARPSEFVRARWKDVEWNGWRSDDGHVGAVLVLEAKKSKTGKKTGKKRRIFIAPRIRRALLRSHPGPVDPETPLFVNSDGNVWSSAVVLGNRVMRQRNAAIKKDEEEIEKARKADEEGAEYRKPRFESEGPEKLVNYLWRHTAASTLIMVGVEIASVAELLGTSIQQIQDTYGHVIDKRKSRAATLLTRRLRGGDLGPKGST